MSKSSVYPLYAIESLTPLCEHQKIPQTIRTVFHQDKPIRLVEQAHLTKIGQCSCNLCEKRHKSFCECLWKENCYVRNKRALEISIFKWQSSKSEEKGATVCNYNNEEKYKTKPLNLMQKFRRGYRKSKQFWWKTKAVEAEDTFSWILEPKEKMFSSETDLNRKLQIKTLREEILKMIKEKELKLNEEQSKCKDKELQGKSSALAKIQTEKQEAASKSSSVKSLNKSNEAHFLNKEDNLQFLLSPAENKTKLAAIENKAHVDKSSIAKAANQSKTIKGKLQTTNSSFLKEPQTYVESKRRTENLQTSQITEHLLEQAEKEKSSLSSSKTKNEFNTRLDSLENVKKDESFLCSTKAKALKATNMKSCDQRKSSLSDIKNFNKKDRDYQSCSSKGLYKTNFRTKTKSFLYKKRSKEKLNIKESCQEASKSSLYKINDKNQTKASKSKLKQTKSFAEKLSKEKQVNVKAKCSKETKANRQVKKVNSKADLETNKPSKTDVKTKLTDKSSITNILYKSEDKLKLKSSQTVNGIEEKSNIENFQQNEPNSRECLTKLNKSSATKFQPLEKSKTKSFSKSRMDIPLPQTNSVLIHYIRNITKTKAFKSSAKGKEIKTKTKLQAKSSVETNKTSQKIPISLQNVELNQSSFTEEQIKQEKRVHLKSLRNTMKSSLKQTKTPEEKKAKMKSLREFNISLNKTNKSVKTLSPITSIKTYNHLMQSVVQRYPKNMKPKIYTEENLKVYEENPNKIKACPEKPVTIVEFYNKMNACNDLQLNSSDILKPESKLEKLSEEKSPKLPISSLETQGMKSSPAKKPSLKLKQNSKFYTSSCYSKTLDKLTNLGKPKPRIQLNKIQFAFAKDPLKVLEDVGFQTLKTKRRKTKEKKL
ncbi:nucleoporin nup211-like [Lucilia sericata]|uniref:nucleoporin nup211-like n=1 Tax=Lucilia sericata TaxID=13632 RepID=UPI0018A839BF|nr:nucleoporin nup211-like [Lucilia sericata]